MINQSCKKIITFSYYLEGFTFCMYNEDVAPARANSTKEAISDLNMLLELSRIINQASKISGQELVVI